MQIDNILITWRLIMSFSIKLNKSNSSSFRVSPTNSSTTYTLTLPGITLSLRLKKSKKKSIDVPYKDGASYKPTNNIDISKLQPLAYANYISKISRLIKLNRLTNLLIPSLLLSLLAYGLMDLIETLPTNLRIMTSLLLFFIGLIGLILKIYLHTIGRLQYKQLSNHKELPSIWKRLSSSDKLWYIEGIYVLDENASKENGGINITYERIPVKIRHKAPFYLHTNSKVMQVKLDDYTLLILPEHYIITKKSDVGIDNNSNIAITSEAKPYAELEVIPRDTEVLYKTWKYVNKDGSKDKRYKKNEQIPICNYGLVSLESDTGSKIVFLSSNNE